MSPRARINGTSQKWMQLPLGHGRKEPTALAAAVILWETAGAKLQRVALCGIVDRRPYSMTAAEFSDTITVGTDYAQGIQLQPSAGFPFIDLTEFVFSGTLENSARTTLCELTFVLVTPKCVQCRIPRATTATLPRQFGARMVINFQATSTAELLPLAVGRISIV